MRWDKKNKTAFGPTLGDTRLQSGHLLFPKCIGTEVRWLEHAIWVQEYKAIAPTGNQRGLKYGWVDIKWYVN